MSAAQLGKPATKRHWELELLRIFSMFLIVATHYFASDDSPSRIDPALAQSWKSALHAVTIMPGQVGVTIFVLISAYFLSRSTRSPFTRVAKIWIQTFIYSCGLWGAYFVLSHFVGSSQYFVNPRSILMSVFPVTFGAYWFISAYVVMVIVAPYINILLDATSARQHGALLCLSLWITFIWHILNPANTWAFTDASYLCTLYLIGALIRRHEDRLPRVRWYFAIAIMILCALICMVGTHTIAVSSFLRQQLYYPGNLFTAGTGASPILSVICGVIIFLMTLQYISSRTHASTHERISSLVLTLSPATFGVYLLHENFIFKPHLWGLVFSVPSPSGVWRLAYASLSIVLIYLVLLAVCFVIFRLVVQPCEKAFLKVLSRP